MILSVFSSFYFIMIFCNDIYVDIYMYAHIDIVFQDADNCACNS